MKKRKQKEYEKFMNEQFRILEGHFKRIMLKCHNKFYELEGSDIQGKENK